MKRHVWVVFALIALATVLTSLAYASPPDPSWIHGVYDGDDFDDVVGLLTGGSGAVDPFPLHHAGPRWTVGDRTAEADEWVVPAVASSPHPTRGPPAL